MRIVGFGFTVLFFASFGSLVFGQSGGPGGGGSGWPQPGVSPYCAQKVEADCTGLTLSCSDNECGQVPGGWMCAINNPDVEDRELLSNKIDALEPALPGQPGSFMH